MINLFSRLLQRLAAREVCFVPRRGSHSRRRSVRSVPAAQVLESRALLSAAVVTDLQDYAPGSTAQITAWNSAETATADFDWSQAIRFQVIRTDGYGDLPNGNLPWHVTDGVGGFEGYYVDSNDDGVTDYGVFPDIDGAADGQIGTSWFVEDQYASSSLRLIASQPANEENAFAGATATHDFTDSGSFSWSNSGTQTANVTAGGSAVSLTTAPVLTVPQNNGLVTPTISAVGVKAGSGGSATYVGALPSGLSVTVIATSDSDAANAVGTVNTGTSPGGTSRTITYSVTATATNSTAAGTYVVGFTASNTGINSSSYEFTVIVTAGAGTGNLTVGTQTGTATYGAPTDSVSFFVDATRSGNGNFNGTYSVTGLPAGVTSSFSTSSFVVSGSTPLTDSTLTLDVDNTVNAGSYPFTVSLLNTAAGGSTYTATGTLVVNKAALTVTPTAGQSKVYGSSDPTFAYTVSGLQNTDTAATAITGGALGRAAGETVAGGPYAYTLGTLAANSNYTLSLGGTNSFAITKANATFTVTPYSATYDGSAKTATVGTITGVNGETGATVGTVNLNGTTHTDAGTYNNDAWTFTGGANYNDASGTVNNAITPATATVNVVDYTGVYDAGSHTAGVTITGVGGVTLASQDISGTNVVDSGSVTVSISDSNYAPASGTATLTITPATATVNVVDYNGVYDGNSHTASVTITGVGGVLLASNSLTGTNVSQSGSVTASISDPNYDPAGGTATLNITKATAVIAVTPYSVTYDGTSHTATGSATGVNSEDLAGLDLGGTAHTNAGSYPDTWTFTDVTGNYNDANGTVNNAIAKAATTTVVTINGGPFTYTGLAQTPATVTVTGAGGLSLTPTANYSNNLNAGTATASYTYAESANYLGSTDSKTFVIAKANATFTVTPYNVEYDGVSHTATVGTITGVNGETGSTVGTVNLGGTTHTNAGTYTDTWTFTATANYNSSSGQITDVITVEKDVVTRYIGQTTFVTSGTSSTTAQVTLTASIVDPDNTALIGATVDFIDVTTGKVLAAGVKVAQVAGQPSSGTANAVVTLSTGQYGSQEYVILAKLSGGNYDNSSQALADKTATVVVSKPAAATEIISGGTIANLAGKAGTYGTTASGQTSFSVGLKYNKSGTNPQGKVSLSIKQSDGSTVYIKSNSITSIAMTAVTGGKSSTVYTKASIYRIANDGTMTTIDGNVTLRLDLLDLTGTTNDTIGFTVLSSKDSTMYYSNDWFYDTLSKTWKTRNQAFTGNLTIA